MRENWTFLSSSMAMVVAAILAVPDISVAELSSVGREPDQRSSSTDERKRQRQRSVTDFDAAIGLLAGYAWPTSGQVTRLGPQLSLARDFGRFGARMGYSYLFWIQDRGGEYDGHEHRLFALAQLNLTRRGRAHRRSDRSRIYLEAGAARQHLSLQAIGRVSRTSLMVGVGGELRALVRRKITWPALLGLAVDLHLTVGRALPESSRDDDCEYGECVARARGYDVAMLFSISQALSW